MVVHVDGNVVKADYGTPNQVKLILTPGDSVGSPGDVLTNVAGVPTFQAPAAPASGGANFQRFNASGTWTKPGGYNANSRVWIRCWGAGGSGARDVNAGGGGGGGYNERWMVLSELGATETVTIGAGGAAATGTPGNIGGNSTFGSWLTAYGGGGGAGSSASNDAGGGGGGMFSAGATGGSGTGGVPGTPRFATDGVLQGAGGNANTAGQYGVYNGGGGGARQVGGASIYGGGGGGGSNAAAGANGGASVNGGAGGAGAANGSSGSGGVQPGGGGGGCENVGGSQSGAGGDGRIEVFVFPPA